MEPADFRPRKPFRLWMTGSLAVVMASLCTGRGVLDDERLSASMRVVRHSPFGVTETVERIEAAARLRGQAVIARVDGAGSVIVLASSMGGTPVVMAWPGASPDVPLSVQVRGSADGGADVLVARVSDASVFGWDDLPAPVADDLAALPGLLERALA
jgi:hypothetical protein